MKQRHYTEKELIDIFVSTLSDDLFEVVDTNHIVHIIYRDEDYYVMLRSVSYAGNPHPHHRFRSQLPRRPFLDDYKSNGGIFLFLGYDANHNVYVMWNPLQIRSRLNEKETVSLFCELSSIIEAKEEGVKWSKLPNGGLYVSFTLNNLSSVLDTLSYFKTEIPLQKSIKEVDINSQLSHYIIDLSKTNLSRLEIIGLCMETHGGLHPDWSFLDWRKYITMVLNAVRK